jgi:hypothetical protein
MLPCSTCGNSLRGERDRLGARCPTCREPLYEQARDPHQSANTQESLAGSRCTTHAGNAAVGTCQRCGNYLCSVCWTRWSGQSLCARCLERALETRETSPIEARAHLRQAALAVILGILAWVITLTAAVMVALGGAGDNLGLAVLGLLVFMASPLPGILGVGQGAAAIRARGDHMIMATLGLILSALHTGMIVGMFTFAAWDS